MTTTTTTIPTDELIRLLDGIMAYRQERDAHTTIVADVNRVRVQHAAGDIFANIELAERVLTNATNDLAMHRAALEDEGVDWQAIDQHDGHKDAAA